ncbi:Gfo/Idh/MocA family oxidoreductase, partial [Thermus scotoductus]|uniref:Gfo/Idh/MocA family oxidoreductase n=1 Tax=Thermus scotoductus TaxID=37636 RepID=UPI003F5108EB
MGIIGASGYGGGELIRLLKAHPGVELVGFSSRKHEGKPLSSAWPQLWDKGLFATLEEVLEQADVVFLALPNGLAMELAPRALKEGKRVIDLSGDYRLPPEVYESWYGIPHKSSGLYREAVYGLPELHRKELGGARLVANPGCYVTATTLALAPAWIPIGWPMVPPPNCNTTPSPKRERSSFILPAWMHPEAPRITDGRSAQSRPTTMPIQRSAVRCHPIRMSNHPRTEWEPPPPPPPALH